MTKKLLSVATLMCALTFGLIAADVTGKWTFERAGRQGGTPTTVTLTLKADGAALTGTVAGGMGRGGAPAPDQAISEGKVDGSTITFKVSRDTPNGPQVTSYKGTLDGDTLNLEITAPGRGGGDPTTTKVPAKRATT